MNELGESHSHKGTKLPWCHEDDLAVVCSSGAVIQDLQCLELLKWCQSLDRMGPLCDMADNTVCAHLQRPAKLVWWPSFSQISCDYSFGPTCPYDDNCRKRKSVGQWTGSHHMFLYSWQCWGMTANEQDKVEVFLWQDLLIFSLSPR